MNRRAEDQLETKMAENRQLQAANQGLQDQLARCQGALGKKNREMELLEQSRDELMSDYEKLKALMQKPAVAPPAGGTLAVLPAKVDAALREFAKENPDLVEYKPERGMVKLKSDLTFALGSDDVRPAAEATLKKFAGIIKSAEAARFHIYIAGHTDNVPITRPATLKKHKTNWHLSAHRAISVVRVLYDAGVDLDRMGAMGFSKHHPIAPNKAGPGGKKLGNEKNRRVEIWIVPPDRFLTGARAGGGNEPVPMK
jgi:chemotaxis protein MotB